MPILGDPGVDLEGLADYLDYLDPGDLRALGVVPARAAAVTAPAPMHYAAQAPRASAWAMGASTPSQPQPQPTTGAPMRTITLTTMPPATSGGPTLAPTSPSSGPSSGAGTSPGAGPTPPTCVPAGTMIAPPGTCMTVSQWLALNPGTFRQTGDDPQVCIVSQVQQPNGGWALTVSVSGATTTMPALCPMTVPIGFSGSSAGGSSSAAGGGAAPSSGWGWLLLAAGAYVMYRNL